MKLLFAHDHIFSLTNNGRFFSPGKLDNNSFSRYFDSFSFITVISRYKMERDDSILSHYNEITDKNIKFIPFEDQSNLKNRFIYRRYFKRLIKDILKEHDGVVARVPSEIGFLVASVAYELNMPYVCEVVACPRDAMRGFKSLKASLYLPIVSSEMKRCVMRSYGSLYVTEKFLQERYPCKGLSYSASNVEISESVYKNENFNITEKDNIIISLIGNLNSVHKGYGTVYESARVLASRFNKNINIVLIGPGDKFKKSTNFRNVNIIFTGALKNKEIIHLLDNTDIYIQPSNQEGLPRATIEAMSRGIPCIVSSAGGLPELVDSKYVHNVGDSNDLAEKILQLLNDNIGYWNQSKKNSEKAKYFLSDRLKNIRNEFFRKYYSSLEKE